MIRRFLRSALDRSLESKTLQSLAPLVEKDLHQVITSDTLTREVLLELFSHRCAAVRVPHFYPPDMVSVMRERLLASSHRTNWKVNDPQRGLENSTVESVGTPLVAASLARDEDKETDKKRNKEEMDTNGSEEQRSGMAEYFKTSSELTRGLRGRSSNVPNDNHTLILTPMDKLRLELDEEWTGGARVGRDQLTGRPLLAGAGRIMHPTSSRDYGFCHVDDIAIMKNYSGIFSANVYLETPPRGCGGELNIWPLQIKSRLDFYNHSAALSLLLTQEQWAQDALRRCLPPPISIVPEAGELILICAQRPHAVVGFDYGQRISMQTFIEVRGMKNNLLLES